MAHVLFELVFVALDGATPGPDLSVFTDPDFKALNFSQESEVVRHNHNTTVKVVDGVGEGGDVPNIEGVGRFVEEENTAGWLVKR